MTTTWFDQQSLHPIVCGDHILIIILYTREREKILKGEELTLVQGVRSFSSQFLALFPLGLQQAKIHGEECVLDQDVSITAAEEDARNPRSLLRWTTVI